MDLREARVFLAVFDHHGMTAAGRALHLSPSSVSETVSQIEHRLGVTLFERTSRGAKATVAARQMAGPARELLRSHEHLLAAADGQSSRAASLSIASAFGAGFQEVQRVSERRPGGLHFVICEGSDLGVGLDRNPPVDAAIVAGPCHADESADRLPLWTEERVGIVHRNHELASKPSLTLADIDSVGWPKFAGEDERWHRFWRLDDQRGGPPKLVGPPDLEAMGAAQLVISGSAAIVTLASHVWLFVKDEVVVLPMEDVPPTTVDLVVPRERPLPIGDPIAEELSAAHAAIQRESSR